MHTDRTICEQLRSRVAQRKRAGPITQRSVDRNYALLTTLVSILFWMIMKHSLNSFNFLRTVLLDWIVGCLNAEEERLFPFSDILESRARYICIHSYIYIYDSGEIKNDSEKILWTWCSGGACVRVERCCDHEGTRTLNLWIRSPAPYPLGHMTVLALHDRDRVSTWFKRYEWLKLRRLKTKCSDAKCTPSAQPNVCRQRRRDRTLKIANSTFLNSWLNWTHY